MSTSEVICLSSEDDDNDHSKVNGKPKNMHVAKKRDTINIPARRKRLASSTVDSPVRKRINLVSPASKSIKYTENDNAIEVIGIVGKTEIPSRSSSFMSVANGEDDDDIIISESPLPSKMNNKPLLVVKEKHPVHATNGRQDIFSMFLSQCLIRDKSSDMRKIVEKLKRKYEQLDPNYAHSDEFAELLNEKRNCLMNDKGQVYRHIAEINEEMKSRKKGKKSVAIPSCSSSKEIDANAVCDKGNENEEESQVTQNRNRKVRAIEKAMLKVEQRIKKYEESEVDLDDDHNSTYLITDRYKRRMVELYAKWCELTGNLKDAGRTYLRPIHLKLTGIVTVDQAINSFINSSLAKKINPSKKQPSTPNTLIFPDYVDILKLLHAYNVTQNLGMDAKAERATAKAAFIKLGEYLKSVRQRDFYETFSVMYEHAEDPATKHEELMAKLRENRDIGEKKLNAIFDEYSKKQEEAKSLGIVDDNNLPSDKEDDEEEDEEDEEMDDGDDERLEDPDLISYHDSDVTIRNSDLSSGDEAVIIDQFDGKRNGEVEHNESTSKDKTTESKASENTKAEDIPIESLNINVEIPKEDSISKVALSNKEKVNDDRVNSSSISTNTAKTITNIVQATTDEVNIVLHEIEHSIGDLSEETCAEEKPMLKLRSFAKPPGFWQNSQENQDDDSNGKLETAIDSETVEIIEVDRTEKLISPQPIVKNTININISSSNVERRITTVPLTSTNKDVKIFRRLVTIPASRLTPISKSNIDVANIPSVPKKVIIHPKIKIAQPKQARLVPLSSIEIRNQKSTRPVAHIVGQRKATVAPTVTPAQNIVTATNSNVTNSLCINPIAKGVQVLSNIGAKPSTTTSCIRSIPILATGKTVKYIELKAVPQKVINPLVKQQQNIENVLIKSKAGGHKKIVVNKVDQSNFINR